MNDFLELLFFMAIFIVPMLLAGGIVKLLKGKGVL